MAKLNFGALAKTYRIPLIGGAAGTIFLVEYQRTRAQKAAAAAASSAPIAVGPGGPDAATAALLTAGVQQGAGISLAGQQLGQQLGQGGLDLAGIAVQGATAASMAATGNLAGVASSIAGLAGSIAGTLPSLAPPTGYPAQPVTQPAGPLPLAPPVYLPPSPTPTPLPQPAPAPAPAPAPTFLRYEAVVIGLIQMFSAYNGGISRWNNWATYSSGPVQPGPIAGTWRLLGGGYLGYWLIYGRSGSFSIRKVWRSSTGAITYTPLSPSSNG